MKALFLHPCSTLLPSSHPWRSILSIHSSRFSFSSSTTHYRPWDSNAESFSSLNEQDDPQGFDPGIRFRNKRRRWWSDEPSPDFDDDDDDEPSGILDAVIDSVWIFKVFKSYGWVLPPIIFSLLLNSGPKAFLMALALPLGQSIISLALEKLWGAPERTRNRNRRTKSKTRKRPFYSTKSRVQEEEEQAAAAEKGYKSSWEVDTNGGEVKKQAKNGNNFGGWEDLDGDGYGYEKKAKFGVGGNKQSSKSSMEKGKLSLREKKSDTPLLLRLLIAVFPFLGSWTRML